MVVLRMRDHDQSVAIATLPFHVVVATDAFMKLMHNNHQTGHQVRVVKAFETCLIIAGVRVSH